MLEGGLASNIDALQSFMTQEEPFEELVDEYDIQAKEDIELFNCHCKDIPEYEYGLVEEIRGPTYKALRREEVLIMYPFDADELSIICLENAFTNFTPLVICTIFSRSGSTGLNLLLK